MMAGDGAKKPIKTPTTPQPQIAWQDSARYRSLGGPFLGSKGLSARTGGESGL